jgi:hypothetical protein
MPDDVERLRGSDRNDEGTAFGEELEDSLGSQAQERLADRGPRDPDRSGDLAFSDHPPVAKVPSRIWSLVHK